MSHTYVFSVNSTGQVCHSCFTEGDQLGQALDLSKTLRKNGHTHVTISHDTPNCVTVPGVDAVVDGMTPDGHAYEWSKQHRGSQYGSR